MGGFIEEGSTYVQSIDALSLHLFENADINSIVSKRRNNFSYLLKEVAGHGYDYIYRELPDGVSPFGFPILLEERDKVHKSLYRKGYLLQAIWDELPEDITEEEFPDSHYLRRRVLVLPVHQDIERRHLDAILKAILEGLRQC